MKGAIITGLISMVISASIVIIIAMIKNEKVRPKDETASSNNFDITTDIG